MKKLVIGIIGIGAVLSIVYFKFLQKTPPKIEKLTLAAETSLLPTSVWVAEKKNFFKEEGLNLTIKEFISGKLSFSAMLEGDQGIHISTVAPTPIMFKSFERNDFSILSTFVYSFEDVKVIARKDKGINTPADLRGKKIGTPLGTTGQFFIEAFFKHHNLSAKDSIIVDIAPNKLPSAIEFNKVDAIVVWEPHAYKSRKLLGDRAIHLPSSTVYKETFNFMVMKKYAKSHPETLTKFLRAIKRATEFIKKNKEAAQRIVVERLNLNHTVTIALWDDFNFELSLDNELIKTLEEEAKWAIKNNLPSKKRFPITKIIFTLML